VAVEARPGPLLCPWFHGDITGPQGGMLCPAACGRHGTAAELPLRKPPWWIPCPETVFFLNLGNTHSGVQTGLEL